MELTFNNEITMIIKGNGTQKILSDASIFKDNNISSFNEIPSQIYINGILQTNIDIIYDLNEEINNITIRWNFLLTNCNLMFYGLSNIIKIDFSNFNSSQVTNMIYMFYGCSSLESLILTNFNTELVTNMSSMFNGCSSLESLDLSSFKLLKVIDLNNIFKGCTSLISLDLSNKYAPSVLYMVSLFERCNSLKLVNLSNFNAENSLFIDNIFYACMGLESIDLTNFKTTKVISMANLFFSCSSLKSLNLSSFDTSSVTNMGHMFYRCKSLENLNLNNFNTNSLKYIEYIFYGCSSLKSLDLSRFNTHLINNMKYMFYGCSQLTSLDLSNFDTSSVINMDYMFYYCKSLISLNLNNFNMSLVTNYDKMFESCKSSMKYCIDENIISNQNISLILSSYEKNNCSNLCFVNSNKYIVEKNKCIDYCFNDDTYKYEYKGLCFLSCPNKTYFNYNSMECIEEIPLGYYLNNSNLRTIDRCDVKCNKCSLESMLNNLCISCNTNYSYYLKYNDSLNKNGFINCYNQTPVNYYFDINDFIYRPKINKTNIVNNNTIEEKINSILNNINDTNGVNHTDIINNVYSNNYYNDIYFYYKSSNETIYSYEINSNINEMEKNYTNITFIALSEKAKNIIIKTFNLDKQKDNIYLIINDYQNNNTKTVTSAYDYKLILGNGTELDLNQINEDFYALISLPIRNLTLSNFNYSQYFYEQGYDIYNKNSSFYNDSCTPVHLYENDITLEDRKKDIYPNNAILCEENCNYKGVDLNNKKIICECNLNANKNYTNMSFYNNFWEDSNFFDILLGNINYKIFKCYHLLFSFTNLKTNIAFYLMLASLFLNIIIIVKFYCYDLSRIKHIMIKDSFIDKNTNICIIKKATNIKKTKKKIIMHPIKKKNNIKTKINIEEKQKQKNKKKNLSINQTSIFYLQKKKKNLKKINIKNNASIIVDFKNKKNLDKKENINELPFTQAVYKDKRDIYQIFCSIIIQKSSIINIFYGDEKIKIILFSQYILSLILDFFFNALLYSDDIVSYKYHNNGKLNFIISTSLSLISNIISYIVCYYFNYSKIIEERINQLLEMRKAYYYQDILDIFIKKLKFKIFIFISKEILIIIFCFYYMIIFCIIFNYSKCSLIYNFISSLLEQIII